MDKTYELADSSDWLQTPVAAVYAVEAALRCQVCKDFFESPMITSCSHTFCSLCIRRCLTNDGKCPTCRTQDQELRLRRNGTVAELVEAFKLARPSLSKLAKDVVEQQALPERISHKRKLEGGNHGDLDRPNVHNRKTRSQSRKSPEQLDLNRSGTSNGSPGDEGDISGIECRAQKRESAHIVTDDDLKACPICNQKMKEEEVFSHLDTHQEGNDGGDSSPAKPPLNR